MNLQKTSIAFGAFALFAAAPFAAHAAPTVSIKTPVNGQTLSGRVNGANCATDATSSTGVSRVTFWANSWQINNDYSSPWNCDFDTTRLKDGAYTFKAVAYDRNGSSTTKTVSITISNKTPTTTTPPPAPANTPPAVSFKAPLNGATVKGWLDGPTCEALASDADGVKQVQFFLDSTALNTEGLAPWNCTVDTSKFSNGTHTLKAVATDAKGGVGTGQISINIQNAVANTPPTVAFKAPAAGATLSGTVNSTGCEASASDSNGSVAKVDFYLGTTPVGSKTAAPYQCAIDTTKFANGTHTLMAVATDDQGASASTQRSVSISNTVTPPGDTTPPPAPTLPSTGTKAVPTFESLGLYWTPPSNPASGECHVRYRKQGESTWNEGLPMWYDTRDGECRGSLVHLAPDTSYEVQFSLPSQQPVAQVNAKTWSENYPIAQTVHVTDSSQPLNITQGGTANGYVLYTPAPGTSATIDVADAQNYNVTVAAPYVIVRGLTLKGAKQDGIRLLNGAHDVVIEGNDISGWGRYRTTNSAGWKLGMDMDAGVRAACSSFSTPLERVVIQRNRIHDPRYGANSWSWGHPAGPQGITFSYCAGNHVFRYNEIYSGDKTRSFNDAIGGEDNFSTTGFPVADTDIYGNKISNTWDDAIEAEGGNKNVRIWGNYIDQTATGIASTVVHYGPLYIFRNVYNRSRHFSETSLDSDDRNTFLKAGTVSSYGNGRRYVFHNTTLQATQAGVTNPLGAGYGLKGNTGQPLTNTVSRNNVFHIWKSGWSSIAEMGGSGNNLDYDVRNGGLSAYAGAESNGTVGFPQYEAGHGWQSESGGLYQLAPASPGYDRGIRLPNFNDGFTGAGPDAGAHEAGTPAMRFGVNGSGSALAGGTTTTTGSTTTTTGSTTTTTDGTTSTTGGTTSTGDTSGGTTSGGGVCSTVVCAATQ